MNSETVLTDTNNAGIEEKPVENISPTLETNNTNNLQPKTAPKWEGWKKSFISGIDKIYETLDPGFKAENRTQQESTSINKNLQKQRELQKELELNGDGNSNNDSFNFGAFSKKALNAISDIIAPPISQGININTDNAEVLFDFSNPSYNQLFSEEGGDKVKNTMNNYIKYAKDRLMKFKYPELVQSKFQAMDALFDKIEINTILKSNDAISSILSDEAIADKYKSYLESFNMDSEILEKLQEIIKPVLTLSKDKYSSFQKEFSIVLIDIKENNGDPDKLNKSISEALDGIQSNEASTMAIYSVAACEQLLKIAEVILLYIKDVRLKQNDYNEGKTKEEPIDVYDTINLAKSICSICIILLRECKFIAFEYLNSYFLIYQYIENFNIIQSENPTEERMTTPRINEIKDRIKYNKNIIMKYLESALVNIHEVFMGNLPLLQLLTTYQTKTQKVKVHQPKEQVVMDLNNE
ncbi:hypothetical protein BCR32DRAFT_275012 [Anaeromyces robustus]|uniref:Uncharacterized protein n=1 Tax=Anaeromyces robustus TaxID=1754192 RepID=A0A1Y1XM53_9FUNG|nr:hypothetical protein BCR32DRAFT_275012 [Anaeromyces robustus]|eukprot:ORX86812.1 hypothetical protein BCR32DRAFT_275012 [Anaeromyces robustus]